MFSIIEEICSKHAHSRRGTPLQVLQQLDSVFQGLQFKKDKKYMIVHQRLEL